MMNTETIQKTVEINHRIAEIRAKFCQNDNKKFAEVLEISPQRASNICNSEPVGRKVIEKVLKKFPKVSESWLLTGEGSMLMDGSPGGNQQRGVSVGGDNIVGGSSKNTAEGLDRLFDAVARLVETNAQLVETNAQLAALVQQQKNNEQ